MYTSWSISRLSAVVSVPGLSSRGGGGTNPFQYHLAQGIRITEPFHRVKHFDAGQPTVAVVFSGNAFRELPRGDGGFSKDDAQSIHFLIITDFYIYHPFFRNNTYKR